MFKQDGIALVSKTGDIVNIIMKSKVMNNRLISICIASIGRASLLRTIEGVRACELPSDFSLEIVIADDSLDGSVTASLAGNDRINIRIITSAAKNISLARNACMAHCLGEYLIFIDDDEVPDSKWVVNLVQLADSSGADAVQGCVVGIYPSNSPSWVSKVRPFDKVYGQLGDIIQVGSTCNLLFRRSSLASRSMQFNSIFGKSGGEDTDFCFRLTSSGGVIVCSNAIVYEDVPIERLSISHLARRYARGGHTYATVVLSRHGVFRKGVEIIKALIQSLTFSLLALASYTIRPAVSVRFILRVAGNVGKLSFFLGLPAWQLY